MEPQSKPLAEQITVITKSESSEARNNYQDQVTKNTNIIIENMEEPRKSNGKNKKLKRPPPSKPGVKDDLTILAHCSILMFVVLICYLCFSRPFEFFTWHPLLLSVGWMLLMTEAVLVISKENPIVRKLKLNHTWKIRYHWILLTFALAAIAIGFLIVVINKNRLNKEHFKSWHGLFGLIGVIASVPATLNGVGALFDVNLKNYVKPNIIKLIHQASGTIAFLFGGLSLILSVYTKWFAKSTNYNKYLFLFGIINVSFPVLWTLQRPLLKCFRKMFKL